MKHLKAWMAAASTTEQARLAKLAKTSRPYLYQLANGNRDASADLARRIEKAAQQLRATNPSLPALARQDLCAACGRCEFAARQG